MPRQRLRSRRPSEEVVTEIYEEAPPPPGPPPQGAPLEEPPISRELWPWMLVLLALVLAGLAAAYFVSRDDGRKTQASTTVVTTVAASPATPTPAPKPVVRPRVEVPNVLGIPAATAIKALQRKNLRADVKSVFSTKPSGIVAGQKPAPGVRLAKAGTVTLLVSKGGRPAAVPDLVGQSAAQAINVVQAQGFKANVVRVPSTEPAGTVVAQTPKPGEKAPGGSIVRLNVSSGPQQTTAAPSPSPSPSPPSPGKATKSAPVDTSATIPGVVGEKLKQARKEIRKSGLITEVKYVPSQEPEGTVVAQSPKPDTSAKTGDHVLVNVSLGPKPSGLKTVPDVVGQDVASAVAELEAAAFKVQVIDEPTSDQSQDGLVVDEQPAASTQAPAGSEITIYVGRFSG
jgi:beta-lactam-binding protein with PASTA domain